MARAWLPLVSVAFSVGAVGLPTSLFAAECLRGGKFYEDDHYAVSAVSVEAPFDLVRSLRPFAGGNGLPIRDGSLPRVGGEPAFNYMAFLNSASQIGSSLGNGDRVSFAVVIPTLRNCNEEARTLGVLYRVYHLGFQGAASGTAYAVPSPPVRISNKTLSEVLLIQPGIGYDAARHLFGGGQLSLHSKIKGPVDSFTVLGFGSSSSLQLQAQVAGSRELARGPISYLDWGVAYVNTDLPTGLYAVSEKTLAARIAATGKTLGTSGVTLHFGGSVEGGNQRSVGPAVQSSIGMLRSPTGSLKLYVGPSWAHNSTTMSGSYGIEVGDNRSTSGIDFVKQIVNASVSTRFMPRDHHPLTFESNFQAGWLTTLGTLPLAARFFGGNIPAPFIPGDAWVIQSNPILRSFPARTLTVADGPWGGTSSFSINNNVSYAVWGKPVIPSSLAKQVEPLLQGQMTTFKNVLEDSYVADGKPYKSLQAEVTDQAPAMQEARTCLNDLKTRPGASSDLVSSVGDALDDLDNVDEQMAAFAKRDASADALSPMFQLIVGEGSVWSGYLSDFAGDLSAVTDDLGPASTDHCSGLLTGLVKTLPALRTSVLTRFEALDRTSAAAKAEASLSFPKHVLAEILRSVNLYAISPTLLFDAARLGPQPLSGGTGTRFGLGPAVRFGLINIDFTLGYSFNVRQQTGEPRGAAVVGLTFQNLF